MNNSPVIYREERIWTSMEFISLLNTLLVEYIGSADPRILDNYRNKLKMNIHLDFNDIIHQETDLVSFKSAFEQLKKSLIETPKGFDSNEFSHKIYGLLKTTSDKKKFTDLITKIPDGIGTKFMELVNNCIKLLNNEPIFETIKNLTFSQLTGEWISIESEETPDYDINFNMTDYSPSYSEIKILFNRNLNCEIKIPVRDYTNPKTKEFTIISGNCEIKEGTLFIMQKDWTKKIPVLNVEEVELKMNLFKTNITFKRTTR